MQEYVVWSLPRTRSGTHVLTVQDEVSVNTTIPISWTTTTSGWWDVFICGTLLLKCSFQSKFIYYPSPERFPLSWCTVRTVLAWPIHGHWKLTWCLSSPIALCICTHPILYYCGWGSPASHIEHFWCRVASYLQQWYPSEYLINWGLFVIYAMESPVNAQDHRAESPGMISLLKLPCELKPIDLEMVSKQ